MSTQTVDVVIIGAGAAGMMCALTAGRRGRKVALLDHTAKAGGKILISGGGRCNFTNTGASPKNYVSQNPHFCKSALSRYTPADFIQMVDEHCIAYHEKKAGQLFCDGSATQIITMLVNECQKAGVKICLNHKILEVKKQGDAGYLVETEQGTFVTQSLVVACGGLSIPKVGATPLGYEIAKQFGLKQVATAPALDGFTFSKADQQKMTDLAGIGLDVSISVNDISFREDLLFTHVGLSGPAALQASLHWYAGKPVTINFVPQMSRPELAAWFAERKSDKKEIKNLISVLLPKRLAEIFTGLYLPQAKLLAHLPKKDLEHFCEQLQNWTFVPGGTVGYGKAEVTRGGVDTDELSSKTMEAKKSPGLYFIGEVVDVTGWLGGYNFQWAWASGWAAGQVV